MKNYYIGQTYNGLRDSSDFKCLTSIVVVNDVKQARRDLSNASKDWEGITEVGMYFRPFRVWEKITPTGFARYEQTMKEIEKIIKEVDERERA